MVPVAWISNVKDVPTRIEDNVVWIMAYAVVIPVMLATIVNFQFVSPFHRMRPQSAAAEDNVSHRILALNVKKVGMTIHVRIRFVKVRFHVMVGEHALDRIFVQNAMLVGQAIDVKSQFVTVLVAMIQEFVMELDSVRIQTIALV